MNNITKKIMLALVVMLFLSVNAYAGNVTSASGELDLFSATHVAATDTQDPVGLSPKVEAYYVNIGTGTTDSQWYAISAIHPGGNKVYGTAQDVNNVYSQDHTTGTATATSLQKLPTGPLSGSLWSTNGWEL